MNSVFRITILVLMATLMYAQEFGRLQTPVSLVEDQEQELYRGQDQERILEEMTQGRNYPLEKAVNPDVYILGPGDEIGLNILTRDIMTFPLTVTPTGDLFIPSVGVCHVSGLTLSDAIIKVQNFIKDKAYPKALSYLVLLKPREFKVFISGAVTFPGFVVITPMTRLHDVVFLTEGFHQLAKEYAIEVTRENGQKELVNFHNYLLQGDLTANPTFLEGDRIHVPFGEIVEDGIVVRGSIMGAGYDVISEGESLGDYIKRQVIFRKDADLENVTISRGENTDSEHIIVDPKDFSSTILQAGDVVNFMWERGVTVTGYVRTPGGFVYFPGYSVSDYVSLAGGNLPNGNPQLATVRHLDGTVDRLKDVTLTRGDVIYVPRTRKDIFVGNMSILALVSSLAAIYLTYLRTTGY